jgi:hypothetical protein
MLERATRLWVMSPMMATLSPLRGGRPLASRRVSMSSRGLALGCSWAPSPALITEDLTRPASR